MAENKRSVCDVVNFGLGDVGTWLQGRIDGFVNLLSGVKPTGKVFPLPSSFSTLSHLFPDADPQVLSLLSSLSVALNLLER